MDDPFLAVAIAITLWGSVGGLALIHRPVALLEPYRRGGLIARVLILDLVVIPPAAWAITRLLAMPDEYAIGLILVGATAAGPLGVVAVQLARGDTILALALVTVLEVANAIAVPVWAVVLLPRSAAIPLGIVGAVFGHLLMGYSLSINSMMGVVALSGVEINDALVMIDDANRQRRVGATPVESK